MKYKIGAGNHLQQYDKYGRYCKNELNPDYFNFYMFKNKLLFDQVINQHNVSITEVELLEDALNTSLIQPEMFLTSHAFERMLDREVSVHDVVITLKHPLKICNIKYNSKGLPSYKVVGEFCTIEVNPTNNAIITLHKTHKKHAKKLKGEK